MKRELKFRAWLEGKHGNLSFSKPVMDYDVVLSKNGYWCNVEGGWDIQGEYKTIPIMQYSGLKDKNGKDVYEGDIVQWVVYDDYCGTENVEKGSIFYHEKEARFRVRQYPEFEIFRFGDDIEIIGNIYETRELLINVKATEDEDE